MQGSMVVTGRLKECIRRCLRNKKKKGKREMELRKKKVSHRVRLPRKEKLVMVKKTELNLKLRKKEMLLKRRIKLLLLQLKRKRPLLQLNYLKLSDINLTNIALTFEKELGVITLTFVSEESGKYTQKII